MIFDTFNRITPLRFRQQPHLCYLTLQKPENRYSWSQNNGLASSITSLCKDTKSKDPFVIFQHDTINAFILQWQLEGSVPTVQWNFLKRFHCALWSPQLYWRNPRRRRENKDSGSPKIATRQRELGRREERLTELHHQYHVLQHHSGAGAGVRYFFMCHSVLTFFTVLLLTAEERWHITSWVALHDYWLSAQPSAADFLHSDDKWMVVQYFSAGAVQPYRPTCCNNNLITLPH